LQALQRKGEGHKAAGRCEDAVHMAKARAKRAPFKKRPGKFPAAFADCRDVPFFLRLDDRDDLVRTRIDDDNLVADQDVVVAPPLGIDCEYSVGQRV
jgi:hypothetical protein